MAATIEIIRETRRYRLTGTSAIMGSNPANPDIHSQYVAAKAKELAKAGLISDEQARAKAEEETSMLPSAEELAEQQRDIKERGLTVFLRNGRGELCLSAHVIKGYFKSAFTVLKDQLKISAVKGKVDNLIFVSPAYIPILMDGRPVHTPDGYCERPLRAETMQGPRISLASSELLDAPWELEFELTLIGNSATKRSVEISWAEIECALSYGEFKGLGQWRNGGYGSFRFERLPD